MPTPSCTNGASSTNSSDATNVCGNLEYTLNYITGTTVGAAVASGDTFTAGQSKEGETGWYKGQCAQYEGGYSKGTCYGIP